MSKDHKGDTEKDLMNADEKTNDDEVDTNNMQQNEDNEEESHHTNDGMAVNHPEGSTSLNDYDEAPNKSAAVDMTGSIRLSSINAAASADLPNNNSEIISSNKEVNDDEDDASLKKRSRYCSSSEDEWGSSSLSIHVDASNELTVQQIHDQRVKLAAMNPVGVTQQADNEAPSKTHLKKSSGSGSVPGAYSVNPSGRNVLLENSNSVFDNEYSSSMTIRTNEHASSSIMMMESAPAIMQLEAVPVDESLEQAKMKEMEEQMNVEMERRLSVFERQQKQERKTKSQRCARERTPIVMALLILLSGISVGLYFLLAPTTHERQEVESSSAFFIHPPPTAEECEAVLRGETIPNQDNYSTLAMGLTLDVSYDDAVHSIDEEVLFEVLEWQESIVVPTLVGCHDRGGISQENINRTFVENRYLIANAQVMNVTRNGSTCDAAEPSVPCVRVTVNFLLWLKAETSFTYMIANMQANFGPALESQMSEGGTVKQTKLVSFGPWQPNDEPKQDLQHPPPTAEECEAILSGNAVPDQDEYSTVVIDLTIDVSVYAPWEESIDTVVLEFRKKLESSMVPILVGCNTIGQEIYSHAPAKTQYIFANIIVMDVTKSASECHSPGDSHPCVQMVARFFVWLKRELEAFDGISFVHNNFQHILKETIGDSDIIQQLTLVSAGPANIQFEFPPPTEKQCEAMSNGNPVPGQDQYFTQLADSMIDVSTHEPWEDNVDTVLLELRNTWQALIIPTLAGCMDKVDEIWSNSTMTLDRYVWVNSLVLNVTHVPGECNAAEPRPCLKVKVRSQMWLEKELDFFALISIMDKNFGPALKMAKIGSLEDKSSIIKQAEIVTMMSPPL